MADILHRVGIRAGIGDVYDALSTPEGVAKWWTTETTGDRTAGGKIRFRFSDHERELGRFEMQITELSPGACVAWRVIEGPAEWLGTTIRFELKREDGQTIVLFHHAGWKDVAEFMHHCSTKWAVFLLSLKALGETGRGAPSPHDMKIDNWN